MIVAKKKVAVQPLTHGAVVIPPPVPDADPDAKVRELMKKTYKEKKLNRSVAGNGLLFGIMIICGIFIRISVIFLPYSSSSDSSCSRR